MKRLNQYTEKSVLLESGKLMRKQSKEAQQMVMKDDLRRMKRVLKYMKHVDESGVVQLKGRTACEINTANELVVTELTFGGGERQQVVREIMFTGLEIVPKLAAETSRTEVLALPVAMRLAAPMPFLCRFYAVANVGNTITIRIARRSICGIHG